MTDDEEIAWIKRAEWVLLVAAPVAMGMPEAQRLRAKIEEVKARRKEREHGHQL
jgi:hypothetical protein